jgi:hypothetical protein
MSTPKKTKTARGAARGKKLKTEFIVLEQEDYCDTADMVAKLARKFSFHQLVGLEDVYGCGDSPAAIIFSNRRLTAKQVDEVIRQNVDLGCE